MIFASSIMATENQLNIKDYRITFNDQLLSEIFRLNISH